MYLCVPMFGSREARGPPARPMGKGELHGLFKDKMKDVGLKSTVRANKAGCLDQCEHGPTVVVYPEAVWYGHVTPADVDEIVTEHLVHGRPVERLMLADELPQYGELPASGSSDGEELSRQRVRFPLFHPNVPE